MQGLTVRGGKDVVLGAIVLAVCVLYTVGLLVGWYLTKRGRLDVSRIVQSRRGFADPLTRRFQAWCQAQKMEAIRRQDWGRLRLLIVANNLGAVALVGRTLYGIALVPAVYLTFRQGLSQGTFAAQSSMRLPRALILVAGLEFGAYLLATALGVNLAVTPVLRGAFGEALSWLAVLYPLVASMLMLGAHLEVSELRSKMPAGLQLPEGVTVEELRARALAVMKSKSGGSA